MSTAKYNTVGSRFTLFENETAMPAPADVADSVDGNDVTGFAASSGFPAKVALHLVADGATTLTDVVVYTFEKVVDRWVKLGVPPSGAVMYPTLELDEFGVKTLLEDIGDPTHIKIAATVASGQISGYLQRVESK